MAVLEANITPHTCVPVGVCAGHHDLPHAVAACNHAFKLDAGDDDLLLRFLESFGGWTPDLGLEASIPQFIGGGNSRALHAWQRQSNCILELNVEGESYTIHSPGTFRRGKLNNM